jgi:hypothetical protein
MVGTSKTTDANRKVTFAGLAAGSYYYLVEHLAGAFGQKEYWGRKDITLSSGTGTVNDTFTRNQPYIGSIGLFNNSTNVPINTGDTIPTSTQVRAEMQVLQPSGTVTGELILDVDKAAPPPPYDSDTSCNGTTNLSCLSTALTAGGAYHRGYILWSNGVATDSGEFYGPVFNVLSYNLTVTVNNDPSNSSLPATGNGKVTLFTSSGTQVGTPRLTNSSRQVTFTGLVTGNYYYRVEHLAGEYGETEYWGQEDLSLTGSTANVQRTFTRRQPYVQSVTFYDNANNSQLSSTSTIAAGATIRAQITFSSYSDTSSSAITAKLLFGTASSTVTPFAKCGPVQGSTGAMNCIFAAGGQGQYNFGLILATTGKTTDTWKWQTAFIVGGYRATRPITMVITDTLGNPQNGYLMIRALPPTRSMTFDSETAARVAYYSDFRNYASAVGAYTLKSQNTLYVRDGVVQIALDEIQKNSERLAACGRRPPPIGGA